MFKLNLDVTRPPYSDWNLSHCLISTCRNWRWFCLGVDPNIWLTDFENGGGGGIPAKRITYCYPPNGASINIELPGKLKIVTYKSFDLSWHGKRLKTRIVSCVSKWSSEAARIYAFCSDMTWLRCLMYWLIQAYKLCDFSFDLITLLLVSNEIM